VGAPRQEERDGILLELTDDARGENTRPIRWDLLLDRLAQGRRLCR